MDDQTTKRAREIISQHPNSVLITVDEGGQPVDRIMWTAGVGEDMTIYYATYRDSDKVRQIGADPSVLIMWITDGGYLAMKGKAEMTDDRQVLDSLWRESFTEYFPGGRDDPNYVALRVAPSEISIVDNCQGPVEKIETG